MTVAKIYMEKENPVSQAAIERAVKRKGNIELVHSSCKYYGDVEIILMAFEKYYLRTSSMTAATIELVHYKGHQYVTIISTGGGDGIFNVSYGSNKNFAVKLMKILEGLGFTEKKEI